MLIRLVSTALVVLSFASCGEEPIHVLDDQELSLSLDQKSKDNLELQKENERLKREQKGYLQFKNASNLADTRSYGKMLGLWQGDGRSFCFYYNPKTKVHEYELRNSSNEMLSQGFLSYLWSEKVGSSFHVFMRLFKAQINHIIEFHFPSKDELYIHVPKTEEFFRRDAVRRHSSVHMNIQNDQSYFSVYRRVATLKLPNKDKTLEVMREKGYKLCTP